MKNLKYILGTTLLFSLTSALPIKNAVVSAAEIIPSVEVKYNLDEQVFTDSKIKEVFKATAKKKVKVYFFETTNHTFLTNDYIHRLRVYENSDQYDLTYKKRFQNQSVAEGLAVLADHEFTGTEKNYKFEVDSKNEQDILSVSRKEELPITKKISYTAVDQAAAIKALLDNSPKKIKSWDNTDWYTSTLQTTKSFGPALVQSYTGEYQGAKADIESWEYNGKTMVEISTKTTLENATQIKTSWKNALNQGNFLSTDQRGKTNFVLFD